MKTGWLVVFLALLGCTRNDTGASRPTLVVLAHDSLLAADGLGPALIPQFEKRCDCVIRTISAGGAGQIVSRLLLDQERSVRTVDVAWGIDQHAWERARDLAELEAVPAATRVLPEFRVENGFVPFDHGPMGWMMDRKSMTARGLQPPREVRDLLKPEYRGALLLQDPRTSTPGLAWVHFTHEVLGEAEFKKFWKALRPQWVTLSPGWTESYGMFLKGQAPMVWSYLTSQAYHVDQGDPELQYRAVVLKEGTPLQIEGAFVLKGLDPETRKRALDFLEFLLTPDVQVAVMRKNWMLPVVDGTVRVGGFATLPASGRLTQARKSLAESERILSEWNRALRE